MASENWSGQPNGRIDTSKMRQFRGLGKYMQPDAANALENMFQAASAAGITLYVSGEQDLYRDFARQQYFWDNRYALGVAAAVPGYSNHGWGLAADISHTGDSATWNWLQNNASRFNYRLLTVPSEKWHILYIGPTTSTAGGGGTPINPDAPVHVPTQDEKDEMSSNQTVNIIRNYSVEDPFPAAPGHTCTAIFDSKNNTLELLNDTQAVDDILIGIVYAYNLPVTNAAGTTVRTKYGAQLNQTQWDLFVGRFTGTKIGF